MMEGFSTMMEGFGTMMKAFSTMMEGFSTMMEGFSTLTKGFSTMMKGSDTNYYRLQRVIKDGASTYSKVVSASLKINDSRLTIYPNPARSSVTICGNHISSVQVIDNIARVVKVVSLKDANSPVLFVSGLPTGFYHLRIQSNDGKLRSATLLVSE
jgi:Secretion system C-terminal sorting domain